ncbi:hypothetical protein [Paenibacillus sp. NPDC058174]|uniref:hypothetical protein n=1 Tax=Paenibacillus sp. NPDC058174 TaxID=3346366 RepID=UPI0036D971F9
MAVVTMGFFQFEEKVPDSVIWFLDYAFILIFPNFGFAMNRTTMRAWKEDGFTDKLAEWRSMPIPLKDLILGRMLQLFIILLPMVVLFFSIQYLSIPSLRDNIDLGTYGLFALFWFCFAIGIAVTYIFFELGYSSRMYSIYCIVLMIIVGSILVGIKLAGVNVVLGLLRELQAGHWWYTAGAMLYAVIALAAGYAIIVNRLRKRSFINKERIKLG